MPPARLPLNRNPPCAGVPQGTGWQVFTKLDVILTVAAVLGTGLATALGLLARRRGVPGWTLLGGALVGGIGTVASGMLVYRIVDLPGDDAVMTVEPGAFVGLALIVGLAIAGWTATVVGLRAVARGYAVGLGPVVAGPERRLPPPGTSAVGDDPDRPPALPSAR